MTSNTPASPFHRSWGLRCPRCRSDDAIDIAATVWVCLCPDGTDATLSACGDHEWDDDTRTACGDCGFTATVRDFEFDGGAS